ncbi:MULTISPECIES: lipoyl domain-containing protein [unclassified Simplicispira]|uniref:lipoyl domain-containing protein n=1 Tax=unclassified Simplicispira TaxID=2630407 RepID=UPI000D5C96F5|nr:MULTISPECIES: lipoyl domain-containing protein [unclassified Simplicispira]PVY57067.1 biotin-dependent enzyme [Simplicispira sp. 125]REG18012.1 biotin-dependent enzyme [Simplicispira sp. 110]
MTAIVLNADAWQDVEPGTEALVEDWLVKEGDHVSAGQPVVSVVVVKANHEVLAPMDGVIGKILVAAEETFKPGQALATLQ